MKRKRVPTQIVFSTTSDVTWLDNQSNEYFINSSTLSKKCKVFADLEWETSQTITSAASPPVVRAFFKILYDRIHHFTDSTVLPTLSMLSQYGCDTNIVIEYLQSRLGDLPLADKRFTLTIKKLFWKVWEIPDLEQVLKTDYDGQHNIFRGKQVRFYVPSVCKWLRTMHPEQTLLSLDWNEDDVKELGEQSLCEVLDTDERWKAARVDFMTSTHVFVHYLFWDVCWDEWIPRTSTRIGKKGAHSKHELRIGFCKQKGLVVRFAPGLPCPECGQDRCS
jgi:hypothetical protein